MTLASVIVGATVAFPPPANPRIPRPVRGARAVTIHHMQKRTRRRRAARDERFCRRARGGRIFEVLKLRRQRHAGSPEAWPASYTALATGHVRGEAPVASRAWPLQTSSSPTSPPGAVTSSSPTTTTSCASRSAGSRSRSSSPTPRSGRRRRSRTGCSSGWASSASSGWTSPWNTAGRAVTTTPRSCWPRSSCTLTAAGSAMGVAVQTDMAIPADPRVRHRGAEAGVGRTGHRRARRSSVSASPSPTPARTSPASRRAPCATATSTSSTAPRRSSPTATAPTASCS